MNRKIIISTVGFVIIIAITFGLFKMMTAKKVKEPSLLSIENVKFVRVQKAEYKDNIFTITSNGRLKSKNTAEIFSEVQGVLDLSSSNFRVGNSFRKGDVLLKLDNEEARLQLISQKSEYLNLLAMALPDIKTEFPQSFGKWNKFSEMLDINRDLPDLPGYEQGKEKFFLASRKLLGQYYAIKNLEVRLAKYIIKAPFDGVITASMIEPGTLVRTGQKLGELSGTGSFELELSLSPNDADLVSIGTSVTAYSSIGKDKYSGSIIRKSNAIDPNSQTIKIYVQLNANSISDGMYLNAEISGKNIPNSIVIPRKALVNNSFVYLNTNSKLTRKDVKLLALTEKEAFIQGVEAGEMIIIDPLVNPILGMKVQPY